MRKFALATAATLAVISTAALAAVTFNPATGTGFAGKGDVAAALGGLNNAEISAIQDDLEFAYTDSAQYDVPCMKDNGRQVLRNTFDRKRSIDSAVAYDTRKNKNSTVTGFNLNGWDGETTLESDIACPSGWEADGEPVLVEGTATGGVLTVNDYPLPITG